MQTVMFGPTPDPVELSMPHSVWLVQQDRSREQRSDRYVDAVHHSQKMPPMLARRMIEHLGDSVTEICDPFGGVGTTGVEAISMGKRFVGVELEPKYVEAMATNLKSACWSSGVNELAFDVQVGDCRRLPWQDESIQAVVTSPPYGKSDPSIDSGRRQMADRSDGYAGRLEQTGGHANRILMSSSANLVHLRFTEYRGAIGNCLHQIRRVLVPGGFCLMAVREFWSDAGLIDLPGTLVPIARDAGLLLHDKIYALDVMVDEQGRLKSRASAHRHIHAQKQADGRAAPKTIPEVTTVLVFQRRGR